MIAISRLLPRSWRIPLLAGAVFAMAMVGSSFLSPASTQAPSPSDTGTPAAQIEINALTGSGLPGTNVPATGTSADGTLSFTVANNAIAFGDLAPGETSAPAMIEVRNTGKVPLTLDLSATALAGPEGTSIPASRLSVSASSESRGASLGGSAPVSLSNLPVAAGASLKLYITLEVPSGDEAYVPQGSYTGIVTLTAKGVTA